MEEIICIDDTESCNSLLNSICLDTYAYIDAHAQKHTQYTHAQTTPHLRTQTLRVFRIYNSVSVSK
jgi:hypothetical protein